jgi:hypothetical protein
MFTFLAGLLAIPFVIWLLILIDFIVITALVENEEGIWATIVAVGSIVGLNALWKLHLLDTIKANPLHTALLVLSYFVIGICWSLFKWYLFLHKETNKYEDAKAEFLQHENATALTGELAARLFDKLTEHNKYQSEDSKDKINAAAPLFRNHKGTLTRWATYWPFSMVGFALNDVVRKSWKYIVELFQNVYQRISNHMFRNVAADANLAQEYKAKQAAAGADGGSSTPRNRRGN